MHSIQIGDQIVKYPSSISEMTERQFKAFAGLIFRYQTKEVSFVEFSVKLTYSLMNMKRTTDPNQHEQAFKIIENINAISKLNEDFFYEEEKKGKKYNVIKLDFVKNLIPKIKVGNQWYYGPSDALTNTEFGEYVTALNAYLDFSQTGDIADLDLLVSALYRPQTKNKMHSFGDQRIAFDKNLVPFYRSQMASVSVEEKYAVYLFFSACQHFIVTSDSLKFSGGVTVNLSVLFNSNSKEKGIGMAGAIYSLAESNVFGDAEKVSKQNTYDVFLRMVQAYLQAKKMKKNATN